MAVRDNNTELTLYSIAELMKKDRFSTRPNKIVIQNLSISEHHTCVQEVIQFVQIEHSVNWSYPRSAI